MKKSFKKIVKYSIYPVIMLSSGSIIIQLLVNGVNQYLATFPVIIGVAIIIIYLEKWLPYDKDWLKTKNGDFNLDTLHYFVNYGIKLAAQFIFLFLISRSNFLGIFPTEIPFFLQVILALTVIDLFLYLGHWLSHKYDFLWKFHAIHHSSERLYWLNGEKRHPLHQIFEGAPGVFACLFLGAPYFTIVGALSILAINMMLQHCNIDYRVGILKKVFSVAELHRWHHRTDYEEAQVNYGAWLIIWDILFQTYYDEPKVYKQVGEVGIAEEPDFPMTYSEQLLYPFKDQNQELEQKPG